MVVLEKNDHDRKVYEQQARIEDKETRKIMTWNLGRNHSRIVLAKYLVEYCLAF